MSPPPTDLPPLDREALADDPIEQLGEWWELAEARGAAARRDDARHRRPRRRAQRPDGPAEGVRRPTASASSRNYESVKGAELEARPRAALVIYWRELDRQVRVRGPVHKLTAEQSDEYFATRPHGSQAAASISPQSRPIEREELDRLFDEARERAGEGPTPRPSTGAATPLEPEEIEFWQGREDRMHDRFRYTREGDGWRIERLAP